MGQREGKHCARHARRGGMVSYLRAWTGSGERTLRALVQISAVALGVGEVHAEHAISMRFGSQSLASRSGA